MDSERINRRQADASAVARQRRLMSFRLGVAVPIAAYQVAQTLGRRHGTIRSAADARTVRRWNAGTVTIASPTAARRVRRRATRVRLYVMQMLLLMLMMLMTGRFIL